MWKIITLNHLLTKSSNQINQQQQDSFNENTSKADNLRRGLDTAPAQGPASAGIHIYTVTNTNTIIHIAYTHTHTHDNSHSLPFQASPTPRSLPYLFLISTLLTSTRLHPNQLPIPPQEPSQIITKVPSHTTISLPSPRLSLICSLHHLDLYLLTTNITHITQTSTNTTQQQQIVM